MKLRLRIYNDLSKSQFINYYKAKPTGKSIRTEHLKHDSPECAGNRNNYGVNSRIEVTKPYILPKKKNGLGS